MRPGLGLLVVTLLALLAPAGAAAAQGGTSAVVMVSGFLSSNPFTSSSPSCAGQEGQTFTTIGPALRAAGRQVFSPPQGPGGQPPAPCAAEGQPLPPPDTSLDTQGDVDANGRALARFVAFLRDNYGVTSVQFVAHSDGGIWSRSAINQGGRFDGVRVLSLTTLGTPHTGSFVADGAAEYTAASCSVRDRRTAGVCRSIDADAALLQALGGPTAIAELSSTFMATWNRQQALGDCPVTTVAGIAFAAPVSGRQVPNYYNPGDGVVGQASALARDSQNLAGAPIEAPRFSRLVDAGSYDAVHTGVLLFGGPTTLLVQPEIVQRLVEATARGGQGTVPCNGAPRPRLAGRPVQLTVPFRTLLASSARGTLPPTRGGDWFAAPRGVVVSCGRRAVSGTVPPGIPQLEIAALPKCARTMRVSGGTGLALRRDPRRAASLQVDDDVVRVSIHGRRVRSFEVEVQRPSANGWRRLRVDRRGRARLPGGASYAVLRIVARAEGRDPRYATAVIDR